ncbi:unnamed protein product [Phyllotreta striolata]|uniref:SAM domain-containing protein n=1 Tax=Phyllotreta striolata TaxID=444603 RepID=A0A9N9U0U3_PHYSR|nr:unnamed protein product [Phyllotreta striolata]
MQTKNINSEQTNNSNNNNNNKNNIKPTNESELNNKETNEVYALKRHFDVPPLPPRIVVTFKQNAEVDGYSPYKPVPPPKPLVHQQDVQHQRRQTHQGGGADETPPPYRMPPYPLYNEPNIPGAAAILDPPVAASSPVNAHGLHTHSSKFPIEREVILSSTDKNSKIPILHEYKKRSKVAVAPDVPPKQVAAWTQNHVQNHQILPDQTHSGLIQTIQQTTEPPNGSPYRLNYHHPGVQEYYNVQGGGAGTGAVPRTTPCKPNEDAAQQPPDHSIKDQVQAKDQKSTKAMTKTYNAIKGMISDRFKQSKDVNEEKYNRQMAQARSQEMLDQIHHQPIDQHAYYQRKQLQDNHQLREATASYAQMHQSIPTSPEKRSAQQLERDNLRQRSFEARRAASQPQLSPAYEDQPPAANRKPQPQIPPPIRRGSHGNIADSDDGGFLRRKDDPGRLQGAPRKRLEGEIGRIEGVYQVAQKLDDDAAKRSNGSDYDKTAGELTSNIDSGRGSAAYSSNGRRPQHQDQFQRQERDQNDSEWVDIVENELRNILEPKLQELHVQEKTRSIVSESASSMTPPLPPLSPGDGPSSDEATPRNSARYKHNSLPCGSRPEYESYKIKNHIRNTMVDSRWNNTPQKHRSQKKIDNSAILRGKQTFGLDMADLTSCTTTRSMDLESILDTRSRLTDSDEDLSTTDARAIRKQLEGLETMYSEVLKLLGVKKHPIRYQPSDPRFTKQRCRYGSASSLPSSSVSSRMRDRKRPAEQERRKVRDVRGVNRRFQRLESHVVTLARSVAHLSSEMRTQHLVVQEMESIRGEMAALRAQTNMLNVRAQAQAHRGGGGGGFGGGELPVLANPSRVRKLTKFFGDEPPLLRLFLRKLGYEKYANIFENEKIGMVELPYLSEERLLKMGLPLGPRLRIMQEAQISVCKDNTLCIV